MTKRQVFSTAADNQTAVTVVVLQGERELAKDNRLLGRFNLEGIAPAPRGIPQIEVAFDIDANGIVHVTAKDLGTGKEQKIRIEASSGLSSGEIDRMVKDAAAHEQEDKKRKETIELRNNADQLLYATEKSVKESGDKVGAREREDIEAACAELRTALNGDDAAKIQSAMERVTAVSHKMAEAMYANVNQHAHAAAGAGGGQPGASAGPEFVERPSGSERSDAYDANFTVVDDDKKKN